MNAAQKVQSVSALEPRMLMAAGALDATFGAAGYVRTQLPGDTPDAAYDVVVRADGKVVVAGRSNDNLAAARFNANGTVDSAFGDGGRVAVKNVGGAGAGLVELDGGDVVVGGYRFFEEPADDPDCCLIDAGFVLTRLNEDGSLDSSFGGGDGVLVDQSWSEGERNARAIVLRQSDGRLVLLMQGVSFDEVFRLNGDGTVDTTFADGNAQFDSDLPFEPADAVILPDDRILVVSSDGRVARLTADGDPDPTFVTTAALGAGDVVDLALSGDGGILVLSGSGGAFVVSKLKSDGSIDADFGDAGRASIAFGAGAAPSELAVGESGRIVVVGTFGGDFALAAFTAEGAADASFGDAGKLTLDVGGANKADAGHGIAIQPDGRIVAAGASDEDLAVVRFEADGTLDATFSPGGRAGSVTADVRLLAPNHVVKSVSLPDGRTLVLGRAGTEPVLLRFLKSGKPDTSFGVGGVVRPAAAHLDQLAVGAGGKIVLAGEDVMLRLLTDGKPDTTFATNGRLAAGATKSFGAMTLDAHGRPLLMVFSTGSTPTELRRFNLRGQLDTTFAKKGRLVTKDMSSVTVQADGRVLTGGWRNGTNLLSRYTAAGKPDASFGGGDGAATLRAGGRFTNSPGFGGEGAVAVQADGRILAAAGTDRIARFLSDGRIDKTFGKLGIAETEIFEGSVGGFAFQGAKILFGGTEDLYQGIALTASLGFVVRLNADGKLDSTFGRRGLVQGTIKTTVESLGSGGAKLLVVAGTSTIDGDVMTVARLKL